MSFWNIAYDKYLPENQSRREALLALGNGYIVSRGAFEETRDDGTHYPGNYLAGGYNRLKTEIAGKMIENEDLVNWPNWLPLTFSINNGPKFHIDQTEILEFSHELNIEIGILIRKMKFRDAEKNETSIISRKFVSMQNQHVAGIEWTLIPESWSGTVQVFSGIDGDITNNNVERYSDLNNEHINVINTYTHENNIIGLRAETNQSHIDMAITARTEVFINEIKKDVSAEIEENDKRITNVLHFQVNKLQPVKIEKVVTVFTSKDVAISEPVYQGLDSIRRLPGINDLMNKHTMIWENTWKRCDTQIKVKEQCEDQKILRLHTFHILQTVSDHTTEMDIGVPSRGWHGEAYRGHIFWDEMYILPFLNLHQPHVARAMLMYRYRRLDQAREAAKQEGFQGAMYPWQSGSDGREESQKIHLNPKSGNWIPDNSHRQRHINITIAYNVWQYYQATKDMEFLTYYGAEIILSIAQFWSSIAEFNRQSSRYEIRGVMGPDEYHTKYPDSEGLGLNNNAYTNFMAAWVILRGLNIIEMFDDRQKKPLLNKTGILENDIEKWKEITKKIYIPFHDQNIISQFDEYDKLKEFPWEKYRDKYGEVMRLDRILESEDDTPNRYKASKQADVLMIFYLLSPNEVLKIFKRLGYSFGLEDIEKNIRYYQERTSHGSTLSKLVHSWVYASINRKHSWKSFREALISDFKDVQGGTTPEGIHLGAMAGTVDLIQRCYTGLEIHDDVLWLDPQLPENIVTLNLSIRYRSHWFSLYINHDTIKIQFEKGWAPPVEIGIRGETFLFEKNTLKEFRIGKNVEIINSQ